MNILLAGALLVLVLIGIATLVGAIYMVFKSKWKDDERCRQICGRYVEPLHIGKMTNDQS